MCVVAGSAVGASAPGDSAVDDYVLQRMRELQIPGLSLAIVKDGKVVEARGFGLANVETESPATAETVYKTASLSKSYLAAAALLLAQEGKLSLDERAAHYLEDLGLPEAWRGITVRHLLTHTSGLVRDPTDYEPYRNRPIADVIRSAFALPLAFRPGEKWLYSNLGYYFLAEIVSRVGGQPWNQLIAERLFAPAGMTSSRTVTTTDIVPHRARGYTLTNGRLVNAEDWIAVRPSGAFLSTVQDLARWDAVLDGESLLTASSRREMWSRATLADGKTSDYGMGWYVESFLGRARIHHDGQFPGFRADYERFPDDRLTVIVLANSDQASLEPLALKIAGHYSPALETPPFALRTTVPDQAVTAGVPVAITVTARDEGQAAPASVVEMEIWDSSDKPVHKEQRANEDFAARETKTYAFTWTPDQPGIYSVSVGVYGPKWTPSYAWSFKGATITVRPPETPSSRDRAHSASAGPRRRCRAASASPPRRGRLSPI